MLAATREDPHGCDAAIVGGVVADHAGEVVLRSRFAGMRVAGMLSGEQLRRIC